MNNWGIIIQARTGSTRLPRKMVLPFYNNKGIIEILVERLKKNIPANIQIIVATTDNERDDIIADAAQQAGCEVFRGSENDVLGRFIAAAEQYGTDRIIRVCADNPFIDMNGIMTLIDYMSRHEEFDYVTFAKANGTPVMKTHYGFWAEAVTINALKKVAELTDDKLYHEHVTNYIYANKDIFNIHFINIPEELDRNNRLRLTLDTQEDFDMQKEIFAKVMEKGGICMDNVMKVIEENPQYYDAMEKQIIRNSK